MSTNHLRHNRHKSQFCFPIVYPILYLLFQIQTTALCMCVAISATVALGCLFVPKVYIVLFQPHKNVRQGSKGAPGAGGRPFFGRQSSRFSSLAAMNGDITSPSNRPSSSEQTCPASPTSVSDTTGGDLFDPDLYLSGYSDSDCDRNNLPLTQTAAMWYQYTCFRCEIMGHILVHVTIYRRFRIGRDAHLDQSETYDIS